MLLFDRQQQVPTGDNLTFIIEKVRLVSIISLPGTILPPAGALLPAAPAPADRLDAAVDLRRVAARALPAAELHRRHPRQRPRRILRPQIHPRREQG